MSPLSTDPIKRARQLANLKRGGAPPSPGRPPIHGANAKIARDRLEVKEREVFDAIEADAPLRNADGSLPAADGVLVRLLADALIRLDRIDGYLRDHGIVDEKTGEVRNVVETEGRIRREALDLAEALGMSPRSRAKIGMDLIRAEVAAQGVQADDEARARAAARFAQPGDQEHDVVDVQATEEPS